MSLGKHMFIYRFSKKSWSKTRLEHDSIKALSKEEASVRRPQLPQCMNSTDDPDRFIK